MTLTMETITNVLPGITPDKVRRAHKTMGLPGQKIGRDWFFDSDAVKAWLAERHEDDAHQNRVKMARVQRQGVRMVGNVPDEIGGK